MPRPSERFRVCPFCGEYEAQVTTEASYIMGERHNFTFVRCGNCGASGPPSFADDPRQAEPQAIKGWTERKLPALPPL